MTREERKAKKAAKKELKKRQREQLDDGRTVADMNVEGFSWYNPHAKNGKTPAGKVPRKEYWAMVFGAFKAMLPLIGCMLLAYGLVIALAILWLS